MLGFALPNFSDFHFSLSFRRGEGSSSFLPQLRETFLLVAFAPFFQDNPALLSGMLAAHVRPRSPPAPRLPRSAVPAAPSPFPPPFPPGFAPFGGQPRPGERLRGAAAALPPQAGAGAAAFPAGDGAPAPPPRLFVFGKGSTAPFPSENNEIWDKLGSVCLSSVLWLILCGYKCSNFIILLLCLQAFTCRLFLSRVAVGTGAHTGRGWEMPNCTRRRAPLPKSRSPPDFPLPHLKLFRGLRCYRALRELGARVELLKTSSKRQKKKKKFD